MFTKIVVSFDGSDQGERVFQHGLDLAESLNAQMMILHVVVPGEAEAPAPPMIVGVDYGAAVNYEMWAAYKEQCAIFEQTQLERLRMMADQATARGVRAEFSLNSGDPGRTICEMARSWKADLILMGRRGHTGLSEWFLGSVSNYVMHHAPCSVLIMQGDLDTHLTLEGGFEDSEVGVAVHQSLA